MKSQKIRNISIYSAESCHTAQQCETIKTPAQKIRKRTKKQNLPNIN
ncbi:MAG: hypothetical protein AABZ32_05000 [Bacteroidota bacterium]